MEYLSVGRRRLKAFFFFSLAACALNSQDERFVLLAASLLLSETLYLGPTRAMASSPSPAAALQFCREANEVAKDAAARGHHPFGAVLVDKSGEVLMRQGNVDTVNHAEATLAREAYGKYTLEQLQTCTLYSTFEPCAVSGAM